MIKILHCIAQLPTRTGSGVYYRNLIAEIDRQTDWQQAGIFGLNNDHQVDWLELDQTYPVYFENSELPFPIAGMSDEMPYRSTVYHQMTPVMIEQWETAFQKRLHEAKQSFQPDVIVCHHLWMLAAQALEVFPDRPVIGISHGTDIRQAKHNPSMVLQHVGSLNPLAKVLALSHSDKQDLEDLFQIDPSQIVVTGGAYDPSVFYPQRNKTKPVRPRPIRLIYAGKIVDSKGVFELVEAYTNVRKLYPDLRLDLVGRETEETIARIDQLSGNDPTIRLFDVESQMKLALHMRNSHVFVFPSYYEGMGLIALEALASGLHLVSNRLPGLTEQLGDDLIDHPVISWVDLPPLKNVDQMEPEFRKDYVDRLTQAIFEQVKQVEMRQDDTSFPHDIIREHSWTGLSERIIDQISRLEVDL